MQSLPWRRSERRPLPVFDAGKLMKCIDLHRNAPFAPFILRIFSAYIQPEPCTPGVLCKIFLAIRMARMPLSRPNHNFHRLTRDTRTTVTSFGSA